MASSIAVAAPSGTEAGLLDLLPVEVVVGGGDELGFRLDPRTSASGVKPSRVPNTVLWTPLELLIIGESKVEVVELPLDALLLKVLLPLSALAAADVLADVLATPRPVMGLTKPRADWTLYGMVVAKAVCAQTAAPAKPASPMSPLIKILSQHLRIAQQEQYQRHSAHFKRPLRPWPHPGHAVCAHMDCVSPMAASKS